MIFNLDFWAVLVCAFFASKDHPRLKAGALDEVSGLVCSQGLLFVHNDSGDSARFFAVGRGGELVATISFSGDRKLGPLGVADCEDIALGPGPKKGKEYIYLGDIGDNGSDRPYVTVYRFQEPAGPRGNMHVGSSALHLKYPNGAQDAETLMVDPLRRELLVVSKRQDTVGIYSAPLDFADGDTVVLAKKGSLFLPGTAPAKSVVAGDISRDGRQVLIKSYEKVYYWERKGTEEIWTSLRRKPLELPYQREPQGEAIGFSEDGKGYYCIGEGKNAAIYGYKLGR